MSYDPLAPPCAMPKSSLPSRIDERAARNKADEKQRREVYREVDRRENYRCRAYGTPANPNAIGLLERGHHHHITYRSKGGKHTTANVCLLSAAAHEQVHRGELLIDGNADKRLRFEHVPSGRVWRG